MQRKKSYYIVAGVVLAAGLDAAINISTTLVPDRWKPFLWIVLPVSIILILGIIAIDLERSRDSVAKSSTEDTQAPPADASAGTVQYNIARDQGFAMGAVNGNVVVHHAGSPPVANGQSAYSGNSGSPAAQP